MDEKWNTSDTENRGITWTVVDPRLLYLVEDLSPFCTDRFFLFTEPEKAIEKAKELGFRVLMDINPVPGVYHRYQSGDTGVLIVAIPLDAYKVGSFSVEVPR